VVFAPGPDADTRVVKTIELLLGKQQPDDESEHPKR